VEKNFQTKIDSIQFYDEATRFYDVLYGVEQKAKYTITLSALKNKLSGSVLDVGCGSGLFLKEIIPRFELTIAIDVSIQMLKLAKHSLQNRGVDFLCADIDFLPIRDGIFKYVFAFTVLQNLPDPLSGLNEIIRVIHAEGTIAISLHKSVYVCREFDRILRDNYLSVNEIRTNIDVRDRVFLCQVHKMPIEEV
jgi:ubiquinone/menaquinone biosynthesis C-methylase UbiE